MKNKFILKILSFFLAVCLFIPCFYVLVFSEEENTNNAAEEMFNQNIPTPPSLEGISGAYIYNIENKKEILAYSNEEKIYPSSLTKLVAFTLISDKLSSKLDEKITVTQEMLNGTVGTYVGISAGEIFTVKELMYIAFCGCFNDAVNILAYVCSGSTEAFTSEMNAYATSLGAENTVFTNPTGIHNKGMYTTVSELGMLLLDAASDPLILEVTSVVKIELPKSDEHDKYTLYNRNWLISDRNTRKYLNSYANGLNAGSTVEGGECVATLASKEGLSYLCLVVGGKETTTDDGSKYITSYKLINELIDWSFNNFGYVKLFSTSVPCADISVKYALDIDTVSVVPHEEITMYLPLSFDIERKLSFRKKFVYVEFEAPLSKGDTVGKMTVLYNGEPIGEVELIITKDIEKDNFVYALDAIKSFSVNRVFILSVISAVVYIVLFNLAALILRRIGVGKKQNNKRNIR